MKLLQICVNKKVFDRYINISKSTTNLLHQGVWFVHKKYRRGEWTCALSNWRYHLNIKSDSLRASSCRNVIMDPKYQMQSDKYPIWWAFKCYRHLTHYVDPNDQVQLWLKPWWHDNMTLQIDKSSNDKWLMFNQSNNSMHWYLQVYWPLIQFSNIVKPRCYYATSWYHDSWYQILFFTSVVIQKYLKICY